MHHLSMFIRRTITNSRKTAQPYYTYRLVEGVRTGCIFRTKVTGDSGGK